jgi:hypothetical protein
MKSFYSSPLLILAVVLTTLISACKKDEAVTPDTAANNSSTNTNTNTGTGTGGTGTGGTGTGTGGTGTGGTGTGGTGTGGTGTGGTGTGGTGTGTITDTQIPVTKLTSPIYGAILQKNQQYTMKGTVTDDVAIYQVIIQIRQKNTNAYVLNKTITLPANTKTYTVSEAFTAPDIVGQLYYIASITGIDKTNKKSAASSEISIR